MPLTCICNTIVSLLLPLLLIYFIIKSCATKSVNKSKPISAPEAAGGWPIIGHIHLLRGSRLPHMILAEMADKHGPIFSIRNGVQTALVISSSEMAKECLLLNDKAVSSRPRFIVTDIMGYGGANLSFAPYGPYWRNLRKIVNNEILSHQRLHMLSHVWEEEVNAFVNRLFHFWFKTKTSNSDTDTVLVDLKPWLSQLSMCIIVRIISGKNYASSEGEILNLRATMKDFFAAIGLFLISDALPFLRWMDLGGEEKAMQKTGKEMDAILETWLSEHKRARLGCREGDKDFMDVMLSILEDTRVFDDSGFDADTINKATCLMMLSGASDTTAVFLTWAVSLLLNNPEVLKKARDEVNANVGKNRQVNESDIPKLDYLQAIVKETLRIYPPAPLSGPREFVEDCTVAGYHVKKGTRLIVNLSKIQCDPQVWEDPMEFRPERFLTTHKDVDVKGQNFELIPFGSGRRMCPGMSFGLRNSHLALASFLHAFEFSTPDDAPVDMTQGRGLTNLKATPLNVLIAPRLPLHLYD